MDFDTTSINRRDCIRTLLASTVILTMPGLVGRVFAGKESPCVTPELIQEAAQRLRGHVQRTPLVAGGMLSKRTGTDLYLKLENMQYTGAFKERGAYNKMVTLSRTEREHGVIAASSGNHAQAVAYHAKLLGIPSVIVMPEVTPHTKIRRTRSLGGDVIIHGKEFDESLAFALQKAEKDGLTFIHPFNDPLVIAGQGTVGLEIMQDQPETEIMLVPVGGGGLIAGCATAAKNLNPKLKVYGVEAASYAAMHQMMHHEPVRTGGETLAEGIAVHTPGQLPWSIDERLLEDVLVVDEEHIAHAITRIWSEHKLVAEGAGAVGVAALLQHSGMFSGKKVATPITGGNIDARLFAVLLERDMFHQGQLAQIRVISHNGHGDIYPEIARIIAQNRAEVVNLEYDPIFHAASPMSTAYELIIETKDNKHVDSVVKKLSAAGFETKRMQ
ncbi:threonine ammonia-lyase [Maridesulfovibrio sp.]|uniref:threonine ammonia-lyase n=1 Tax=Maridesulfovibrio sp. TaxID=2795000 RepID=UPI0029CA6A5E|nr:threonine ammonia-lyase [Maridesulfovibrio sp.]